jgi:hypothetical protein
MFTWFYALMKSIMVTGACGRDYPLHGRWSGSRMQERAQLLCKTSKGMPLVTYFLLPIPTSLSSQNLPKQCHQLGTKYSIYELVGDISYSFIPMRVWRKCNF